MSSFFLKNEIKPQYSKEIREMFTQINPYNLTCLYKEAFSNHAGKTLKKFDKKFKSCKKFQHSDSNDVIKVTSKKRNKSASPGSKNKQLLLDDSIGWNKQDSREALIAKFFKSIAVHHQPVDPVDLSFRDICGWETCDDGEDDAPICCSQSEESLSINSSVSSRNENHEKTPEPPVPPSRISHHKSADSRKTGVAKRTAGSQSANPKKTGGGGGGAKQKSASAAIAANIAAVACDSLEPVDQITYTFKHGGRWSDHMDRYREEFTYQRFKKQPCNCGVTATSCVNLGNYVPRSSCITKPITTAEVKCYDVRQGAFLVPQIKQLVPASPQKPFKGTRLVTGSVTSKTFLAALNNKEGASSAKEGGEYKSWPHRQATDRDGRPTSSKSAGNQPGRKNNTGETLPQPQIIQLQVPRAPGQCPIISRSRPSIPSNSNGTISASAVETQKYVISYMKGICNRVSVVDISEDMMRVEAINRPSSVTTC